MSKHTPGPWEIYEQHHPYWDGSKHHTERWIVAGYDDPQLKGRYPIIAVSAGVGLHGQKGVQFVSIKPADARLIAAAPELLEALQAIVDDFEFGKNIDYFGDRSAVYAETARKAIAKATGEQP